MKLWVVWISGQLKQLFLLIECSYQGNGPHKEKGIYPWLILLLLQSRWFFHLGAYV